MRLINILLLACFSLCGLSSCQQTFEEQRTPAQRDGLYVTFSIDAPEERTTRAVPDLGNPPTTPSNFDYESSYKTVDIVFFESNGRKATLHGKTLYHFDATGNSPAPSEQDYWVNNKYERGNNLRGVFLAGISKSDVNGKTCVVVLNLPDAVRIRLEQGANNEITTLSQLKELSVHQISSADEQLGPIPYPKDAQNRVDYNSPDFRHIVMTGIKENIQLGPDAVPLVNVDVERTIAKIRAIVLFESFKFAILPAGLPIQFRYKYFPKNTYFAKRFVPATAPANQRLSTGEVVDGAPVDNALKFYKNQYRYVIQDFYINEYGELNDDVRNLQPSMSMIMTLPSPVPEHLQKRFFQFNLPRGIERNKFYTLYVSVPDVGNDDPKAFQSGYLKARVVVTPWNAGKEDFFPGESYPFNNFKGTPTDSKI